MKKIGVISTGRHDYSLLKNLVKKLQKEKKIKTYFILCGSHFFSGFKSIKVFDKKIKNIIKIKNDIRNFNELSITNFLSQLGKKIGKIFKYKKLDLLLILGDRYEANLIGLLGVIFKIPICHIHGGEITEGSYDNFFRHSLTKLSNFHFVSNLEHKKRVIQMGENPKSVYNVGSLGKENIYYFLKNNKLSNNFKFKKYNYLITFHTETLAKDFGMKNLNNLINVLKKKKNTQIFFTIPNPDSYSNLFYKIILSESYKNKWKIYKNLGSEKYFYLATKMNAIIGNSSSGILETPYLGIPTINIGNRQKGRANNKLIINVSGSQKSLHDAFKKINYLPKKINLNKPFTTNKIIFYIKKILKNNIKVKKKFYNILNEKKN